MNRLLGRLEKLEVSIQPPQDDLMIFRMIVVPDKELEYVYGKCDGRSFDRFNGESLAEFQARIATETQVAISAGTARRAVLYSARPEAVAA